mgnify:CR=1 FL=1
MFNQIFSIHSTVYAKCDKFNQRIKNICNDTSAHFNRHCWCWNHKTDNETEQKRQKNNFANSSNHNHNLPSLSICIIAYNVLFVNSIFKFNKKIRAVLQHCSAPNFFTLTSISKRALDNSQDYRIRICDKLRPAVLDYFTKS